MPHGQPGRLRDMVGLGAKHGTRWCATARGGGRIAPGVDAARRRRGPLAWDAHHLGGFIEELRGSSADAGPCYDLRRYADNQCWGWSSACEGTDSPSWIKAARRRFLRHRGMIWTENHVASLEIDPAKRQLASDNLETPPVEAFSDM